MGIAMGYYSYSIHGLQEMTIRNGFSGAGGTGHIQIKDIRHQESYESITLQFGILNEEKLSNTLMELSFVDYVLPRTEFGGLISNGDKSLPFIGYGINPTLEAKLRAGLTDLNPTLKLGEEIEPLEKNKHGIILGKTLAAKMGARVGDYLMLYGTTVDGAVNAIDVQLVGIMSTGINETDKYYLLTNLERIGYLHQLGWIQRIY